MTNTEDKIELPEHLKEVFARLSRGFHLCPADGELYRDLETNEATYRSLFDALGYSLSDGVGGYYYFNPGETLNRSASKAAVFVLVLAQFLADEGQDPIQAFGGVKIHHLSQMPHLMPQYRYVAEQAALDSEEAIRSVVFNTLVGLGLTERVGDDGFRFRAPIRRFIDQIVALRLLHEDGEAVRNRLPLDSGDLDGDESAEP